MKGLVQCCIAIVGVVGLCIFFFHLGSLSVLLAGDDFALDAALLFTSSSHFPCAPSSLLQDDEKDDVVEQELDKMAAAHEEESAPGQAQSSSKSTESTPFPFGEGTAQFAMHAARASRRDFLETFPIGFLSSNDSDDENSHVLLLSNGKAFPLDKDTSDEEAIPFVSSAQKATQHCQELNVIVLNNNGQQQCTALVSNYESYHVQNWRRQPAPQDGRLASNNDPRPLQVQGRLAQLQKDGTTSLPLPSREVVDAYWEIFGTLLRTRQDVKTTLTEFFSSLKKGEAIVPLVCSAKHVVYLVNLFCSKVLPASRVLVIAMDEETHQAAKLLGFPSFYDETLLQSLLQSTTKVKREDEGGRTLRSVLKLFSLHWIQSLERDVLLFDIERVVWLQDPFSFFTQASFASHQVVLTEEEEGGAVYAPYGSNCMGVAYVRYSVASRHFGVTALYAGDVLLLPNDDDDNDDHFGKLMSVRLSEYSNLYGLTIKVLKNSDDGARLFPHAHKQGNTDREEVVGLRLRMDDKTAGEAAWKKEKAWSVKPNTCMSLTQKQTPSSCCKAT